MPLLFPTSYNKQALESYGLRTYTNKEAQLEEMKFSVRVPASFTVIRKVDIPPSVELPDVDLVFFKSATEDIQVIIQCTHIQYEVSLEHYYHYVEGLCGEKEVEKRL